MQMYRPPAAVPAGMPPAQANRFPAQSVPSQAQQPFTPAPAKTPSKAIKIVNPLTNEVVDFSSKSTVASSAPSSATTPAPAPVEATPVKAEAVKEKNVTVTLKTPSGKPLDFKSPAKPTGDGTVQPAKSEEKRGEDAAPAVTSPVKDVKAEKIELKVESADKEITVTAKPEETRVPTEAPPTKEPVVEKKAPATVEKAAAPVAKSQVEGEVKPEEKPIAKPEATSVVTPEVEEEVAPKEAVTLAEPELEDGEIPESVNESSVKLTEKTTTEEPNSEEIAPTKPKAVSDPNRVITKLASFEGVIYPEGVTPPAKKNGIFKYTKEFLMNFADIIKDKPAGLPSMESFVEDGKPSPRPSRPSSGSGSNFYAGGSGQGSFSAGGKRPSGGGYPHAKGMITVPAPSGLRNMPGRMPIAGSNASVGGQSGSKNAGSWDKGGQGLPPRPGAGGRGYRHGPPPPPAEPPVEPLKVSENAWTPDLVKKKKGAAPQAVTPANEEEAQKFHEEDIAKKVKGLLNKLTIDKFDKIGEQFLVMDISTPNVLKKTIELIFEKALDEYHFQSMYGRLCHKLSNELPKVQTWIDIDAKNNVFRRLLLNKCQEEFEKSEKWSKADSEGAESRQERLKRLHSMSAEEKEKYAEEEYQRTKLKRRVLGNISFIGELFKLQMITEKIMHGCVKQLLAKVQDPEEEETEALCRLLKGIGGRLDHEKAKSHMDVYFLRIKELSQNPKLPSRIRFMLEDLIEQRKNDWKARQEVVGPMTIAEIHALEEKKQREEEEASRRNASGRGGRGGRGGGPAPYGRQNSVGGGRGGPQDVRAMGGGGGDGWQSVDRAKTARQVDDNMNRFGKIESAKKKGEIHLGPQAGNWSKGAMGGSAKDEEKSKVAPTGNKFRYLYKF
jgi:uncharacterized membrane protein YgcG